MRMCGNLDMYSNIGCVHDVLGQSFFAQRRGTSRSDFADLLRNRFKSHYSLS